MIGSRTVFADADHVFVVTEPIREVGQKIRNDFTAEAARSDDFRDRNKLFHSADELVLDQIEMESLTLLQTAEVKNASKRFDRPAFASDQTAEVFRSNSDTELDDLAVRLLGDLDCVSIADERLYDFLDCLFHKSRESIESVGSIESASQRTR